jgi:hypothetical protein
VTLITVIYVYITESYPTNMRNIGYGIARSIGIIGNFSSPYIVQASRNAGINPMITIGFFCIICFVTAFYIEETFNKPVQD